ncbi:MAG: translation initiation factor IF-2 [Patescibacteria group bacterium]|nr:translation initiation factor IF-2 [Patescibacteria group bacterium]
MQKDQHNLVPRPPVVVVMGHIDHGKSTLLDRIRQSNIVAGEAGGITQHVGAYQAEHSASDGVRHQITFLDTPGHAAFCSIRERGAQAADIAILVVSAEDGVKPQTVEALSEIRAAKIPFIVAINKIDKPNADVDRTKTSLAEHEVYVEGWGGDVPCVALSALTGAGVPELLDMIVLVAELAGLKADLSAPASGVVVESELDTRKGVTATLLVKDGTLETGSFIVAGGAFAPVRFIEDFNRAKIERAGPSMPAVIVGWSQAPECGSAWTTAASKKEAEKEAAAATAASKARAPKAAAVPLPSVAADKLKPGEKGSAGPVVLPLIVKADAIGSLEGVMHELAAIRHDRAALKIVSEGIGDINENDVKSAQSDPSIVIVGFNAAPDRKSAAVIERSPVPLAVKSFKVIYELADFVRASLLAKVPKEYAEESTGRAKILALFSKEKDKQVVGGKVESGTIALGDDVRILRRDAEIGRGKVRDLQEKKARARDVAEGHEFGVMVESKAEIAAGDRIESVRLVEKKP